jgi:hypothetical protein
MPHNVVPQARQKHKPVPSPLSYRVRSLSPRTQRNDPGATSAYADPAPLNTFRQREQWQLLAVVSGASMSYLTRPQKQPPLIDIAPPY